MRGWWIGGFAIVVAMLGEADARACSCASLVPGQLPAEGAIDVPTNPVIWVVNDGALALEDPPSLIGDGDGYVELERTELETPSASMLLFRPTAELLPHTTYDLWACVQDSCGDRIRAFTTGDGPDHEAPALPQERSRHADTSGSGAGLVGCGVTHFVELDVEFEGLLVTELGEPEFDPQTRSGFIDNVTTESTFSLGDNCIGNFTESGRTTVRHGTFDLAGNFSGWQDVADIELPGCGCDSRSGATEWLPLAVLTLAMCRRRVG